MSFESFQHLGEVIECFDFKRIPLSKMEREKRKGKYPYYGAAGIIDYVDASLFNGFYLLMGEDGSVINENGTPVLQLAKGEFWVNNHAHVLQGEDESDTRFLYYALSNVDIKGFVTGAVQPKLSQGNMNQIKIYFPEKSARTRIEGILSTLDEKIEINRHINVTLESLTQSLFKEWFVDFNFPGATGQMKDSELGMIPQSWRVGKLEEIISNFDSNRVPLSSRERDKRRGNYPYYGAASIIDYVDDFLFDGVYLLMGEDGTVITDDEKPVLQYVTGKFWVNNHTHVLQGKDIFTTEYIYLVLKNTNVKHIVTGAVQPKINQSNMNNLPVIIPDIETLQAFQDVIKPVFIHILENQLQSQTLASLRDELLPKLMNGGIEL